jgi:L-lysine exporter family protein LysE/ArgO
MTAGFDGFIIGFGLILAIGAQNVYVLNQGLKRRQVFATAAISAFCDNVLIALGAGGLGTLLAANETVQSVALYGGATFVTIYGLYSLYQATRPKGDSFATAKAEAGRARGKGLLAAVMTTLAFALLNPHVYIDTVLLLGGIGAQYPAGERLPFVIGACIASTVWFFSLAYGARLIAPIFRKPGAARAFDIIVAGIMFFVAATLLL